MNNCPHPQGYKRQIDLEHFILTIVRCSYCESYITAKAAIKEIKNG